MVVKMAGMGRSFAGVAAYCLHDRPEPGKAQPRSAERVEWTDTRILATSRGDRAAAVMAATAEAAPERQDMSRAAAESVRAALGLEKRTHWERLQRRRGKELGDLELRSRREWTEFYGCQCRQREQLVEDSSGVLGRWLRWREVGELRELGGALRGSAEL